MSSGVVVRPDQVSLGVLVAAVPRDVIDAAVAACGAAGKLPAHVVTYLTMAMCLFPDDDYEEVAGRVTGSLPGWGCWDAAWSVPAANGIPPAPQRVGRGGVAGGFGGGGEGG